MSALLEKKEQHTRNCEAAVQRQDWAAARKEALLAADAGLQLAQRVERALAERYVKEADEWMELAGKMGSKVQGSGLKVQGSPGAPGSGSGKKETEEPSGESEWRVGEKPSVKMDDIKGMVEAKAAIYEMVVYPLRHPEKSKALGVRAGGGVLLYGPPGNGKTMLGKAIAGELDFPFYYASGAQIRSKWHGESEQRLSALLNEAKSQPAAVLFLDEVDGLLPRRSSGSSVVDNRVVTQFLADVGGFSDSDNALVILGATNKPWDIDEAVFRTGRFDEKIYAGPPDAEARLAILEHNLREAPLSEDVSIQEWAERLELYTGSDLSGVVSRAKRIALGEAIREDRDPLLTRRHFELALQSIPSSITRKMLDEYERFRKQRFG
jgi:transitional endoplasmic reticulum ATPase